VNTLRSRITFTPFFSFFGGYMKLEIGVGQIDSDAEVTIDLKPESKANILANAECLPFCSEVFIHVKFYEVLEHVKNPITALTEINRCLSDDGIINLCVPNVFYLWATVRWILKGKLESHQEHIWSWRIAELRHLLLETGFRICKVMFINHVNALHLTTRLRVLPFLKRLTCRSLCVIANKIV